MLRRNLQNYILKFLTSKELCQIMITNKLFRIRANDENLWKMYCLNDLQFFDNNKYSTFKQFYIKSVRIKNNTINPKKEKQI